MAKAKRKWNPSHHPRDARGRFTRSSSRVMAPADRKRAQAGMSGFAPAKLTDAAGRTEWLQRTATATPSAGSRISAYLDGGWREDNPAMRAGKPVDDVAALDEAFAPLPEDVMLRRVVPAAMFAHIPIDQLVGMKVRDAAPASFSLDHDGPGAPGAVTMHVAAPAGTRAYVNDDAGEVLAMRDTEVAITRAVQREDGTGWDLYGVVIPRKDAPARLPKPAAGDEGDDETTAAGTGAPEAPAAAEDETTAGGVGAGSGDGGEGGGTTAPAAAPAADQDAPAPTARRRRAADAEPAADQAETAAAGEPEDLTALSDAELATAFGRAALGDTRDDDAVARITAEYERRKADVPAPAGDAPAAELPEGVADLAGFLRRSRETGIAEQGDVAANAEQVRAFLVARLTYTDEKTGLTATPRRPRINRDEIAVRFDITDKDGTIAGDAGRVFHFDPITGEPTVKHGHLDMVTDWRGAGFASRFNARNEKLYREQGFVRVTLSANMDVGGYAWARAGYDWTTVGEAQDVAAGAVGDLKTRGPDGDWDDDAIAAFQDLIDRTNNAGDARVAELKAEGMSWPEAMRAGRDAVPTPLEWAMVGWKPETGRGAAATWPGKEMMLRSMWDGEKRLDVPAAGDDDATTAGTGAPEAGDDQGAAGVEAWAEQNAGRLADLAGRSKVTSPGDPVLAEIGAQQGWATPQVAAPAEIMARAEAGWTPIFRGVRDFSGFDGGPDGEQYEPKSAQQIADDFRGAEDYLPGTGNYGNGTYFSADQDTAAAFATGEVDYRNNRAGAGASEGALLAAALDPEARVARYEDLLAEQRAWQAEQIARTDDPEAGARLALEVGDDLGRFAAMRGYDAILVEDQPDGNGGSIAAQYVILNRGRLVVADTWTAGTTLPKPVTYPELWHTAPAASAEAIRAGGFRDGEGRGADGNGGGGAFFGAGVYLSTDKAAADRYLDGVRAYQSSDAEQLTARARVVNPFVVNATARDQDPGDLMRRHMIAAGIVARGDRQFTPREITSLLQMAGHDGVKVRQPQANDEIGGSQLLVFDPADVEITGDAPAAEAPAPRVARMDDPEYKRHYNRGWDASKRNAPDSLEKADLRGEVGAWYDGWSDYSIDVPKWTTPKEDDASDRGRDAGEPRFRVTAYSVNPDTGELTNPQEYRERELYGRERLAMHLNDYASLGVRPETIALDAPGQATDRSGRNLYVWGPWDQPAATPETPTTGTGAPSGRQAPTKVSELERNDHVRLTGETGVAYNNRRTVTGYTSTPQTIGDRTFVMISEWPDGQGERTQLVVDPDGPVDVVPAQSEPNVVLWKRADTGRAVIGAASQPDIVRRLVVRDPEREQRVRQRIAELAGAPETSAAGTSAPDDAPATPAGPAMQADLLGGDDAEFVPADRSTIGVGARADVGRERAMAAVQQLGLFASDEREMAGQGALLDALLDMPAAAPPPAPTAAAVPDAPATDPRAELAARIAGEDLTGWTDEQLSGAFSDVSATDELTTADEAALQAISDEWERREAEMAAAAAAVPADLTAVDEDDLVSLLVDLTSGDGTLDADAVARVEAELDRRDAERIAANETAAKRALVDRDPATYADDAEFEAASGAASDLGDWDAFQRIMDAWEVRETAQRAREDAERAEAARVEAERVEAARVAAEAAAAREAAAAAEAERVRTENAMIAARAAAVIPPTGDENVRMAHLALGEDGTRRVLGERYDEIAAAADNNPLGADGRVYAIRAALIGLPEQDRARLVLAAADVETPDDVRAMGDMELLLETLTDKIPLQGETPEQTETRLARLRSVEAEQRRRGMMRIRAEGLEAFARFRDKVATGEISDLTDAELGAAPRVLADDPDADLIAKLGEVRAEARRRQNEAQARALAKATGPGAPAKLTNPLGALGYLERMTTSYRDVAYGREAGGRLLQARALTVGLPTEATEAEVKAAERGDERSQYERATWVVAWYRHLGEFATIDDAYRRSDWIMGPADEPDAPEVPLPLPGAKVSKPVDVWEAMKQEAIRRRQAGDDSLAHRYTMALARSYGIPFDPADRSLDAMRKLGTANWDAQKGDTRTNAQRTASYIAEWRRLAAEDGTDPANHLHYGPPDKRPKSLARTNWTPTADETIRIDRLVAGGVEWDEAFAEVMGADLDDLRREQVASAVTGSARPNDKIIREHYREHVYRQYMDAEAATNGYLLNKKGEAKGIDPESLFSGDPDRAFRFASEELMRWWGEHPRLTYADYKAQLLGDAKGARERTAAASKGNEFA